MELELELKITKTIEDLNTYNIRIAKDQTGPLFLSRETQTMFILIAHLKGFKREMIKIEINQVGTRIAISGERPVQEMVMVRWKMHKNVEIKGFRKVFQIPDGVDLDQIKANFNEDDSCLKIFMPKSIKGVRGIGIEEAQEEEVGPSQPASSSEPKIEKRQMINHIGETSPEIPECTRRKVVDEITPIEAVKFPATTILDPEKEVIKPCKHESEEIQHQVLHEKPKQTRKHKFSGIETTMPEQKCSPKAIESTKQVQDPVLHQRGMPEIVPSQQLRDDKVLREKKKKVPEEEESQRRKEAVIETPLPEQVLNQPETPDNDQHAFHQIRDSEAKEIYKIDSDIGVKGAIEGGKHHEKEGRTEKEPDSRLAEIEATEVEEESPETEMENSSGNGWNQKKNSPSKRNLICTPCILAGSALLISLVVFATHLVRNKKQKK